MSRDYTEFEADLVSILIKECSDTLFGSHAIQMIEPNLGTATITGSPKELIAFAMRLMEVVRDAWPLTTQVAIRDRVEWNASVGKDKG